MRESLDKFRAEVHTFLGENLSPALAERVHAGYYLNKDDLQSWHRALYRRGWAGINWPPEWGGAGWTALQKYVFEEECAAAGAPLLITIGLNQVASVLMAFGTQEQKKRFLPRILDGSEMWCQGFSEPGSGSDLASLKCAAVREGDEYVVNGSKTWTTAAHWSDWCFLLVRTSSAGKKQHGITILLLDMKAPGIRVRPIIGLDGMHSLNEMFLDDVRVPLSCRVGDEDKGWSLIKVFLGYERISAAGVWKLKAHFRRLIEIARQVERDGKPLMDCRRFRDRLAWLEIRMRALETILLGLADESDSATSVEASLLKLRGAELLQELLRMLSEAAGQYAVPFHRDALRNGWQETPIGPEFAAPTTPAYLFWRKSTISGGSSEIMRNIIAQRLLG